MTNLKYDTDPEALAWARAGVQHLIDRARKFEAQADTEEKKHQWRVMAYMMEADLIGGKGCVIAVFDERLPSFARTVARDEEASE